MNAAIVAVPTLTTAAVFTPAMITGAASGRSMAVRRWRGVRPMARAAPRSPGATPANPTQVLRTIGSSA
jgi:hypothetical protein